MKRIIKKKKKEEKKKKKTYNSGSYCLNLSPVQLV